MFCLYHFSVKCIIKKNYLPSYSPLNSNTCLYLKTIINKKFGLGHRILGVAFSYVTWSKINNNQKTWQQLWGNGKYSHCHSLLGTALLNERFLLCAWHYWTTCCSGSVFPIAQFNTAAPMSCSCWQCFHCFYITTADLW